MLDTELHTSARLQIVKQFTDSGHRTSIIAMMSKQKPLVKGIRIIAVPLRYIQLVQPIMFAVVLVFLLPLYVLQWHPNFVILTQPDVSILGSIPGVLLSKLRRVKCVLDIRSTPVETVGLSGRLLSFWFSVSVLTAKGFFDGITIITHQMKNQVCRRFCIKPTKVGVWTSGVSTILYDPQKHGNAKEELRSQLGLKAKFVVFYHGIFSAHRGLTELVEAMRILKLEYPDIIVFLLGKGPSNELLKGLVEKEKLQSNVLIHRPVDFLEVPKFIAFCDVAISPLPDHPYWRFQCPLKLLEYMAMEKTIILTDIPAHRMVVNGAKCGVYVPTAEPIELANAIRYAYHNRAKLDYWGTTGRKIVEEEYTWEKVGLDLETYLLYLPLGN